MITADTLARCAYLNSNQLESLLRKSYPEEMVITSKFLGITNGGQFAYNIQFPDTESKTGLASAKVFVSLDGDKLLADY